MSDELSKLRNQVEELQQLVKKQNLLISKTGQSVLELQVAKQKSDVEDFDSKYSGFNKGGKTSVTAASHGDTTDFATNEDLVQLVGELQGQLESIEERSIRRLVNSTKTEKKDYLAPLPNSDGEIPSVSESFFPRSLGDFESVSDVDLFKLAKFYELLAPSLKEQEKFEDYLEGKLENFHINDMSEEDVKKELANFTADQLVETFNDVARFLGVKSRRGTDIW
ncbi:LANO_0H09230g1_1 [Lachancea nothofagi CBS 11611]|uniref:LANO_0H09230g1_1 n=1 Tax=Lachancea nothofagi CBS 11611 TaxID=1266666 RepID=A0A1G4KLZ5_9SACH|nr:LANO_0H09230g1_1 [Lachancea nothofagi CBS 11611]